MVAVLGRYASRFSARANDLTLDYSMVWFGVGLALIASVYLAFIPRLPSANAPQGGLTGRGTRVAGVSSRRLHIFAVTQIAASFLLLARACVLMKTVLCWSRRDLPLIRPTFWQ
jgi:putative ABC transport system permease protein